MEINIKIEVSEVAELINVLRNSLIDVAAPSAPAPAPAPKPEAPAPAPKPEAPAPAPKPEAPAPAPKPEAPAPAPAPKPEAPAPAPKPEAPAPAPKPEVPAPSAPAPKPEAPAPTPRSSVHRPKSYSMGLCNSWATPASTTFPDIMKLVFDYNMKKETICEIAGDKLENIATQYSAEQFADLYKKVLKYVDTL